jgi:hypothetical protein
MMAEDKTRPGEWNADWYTEGMHKVINALAVNVVDKDSTDSADLRLWREMQDHPDGCMQIVAGATNVCDLLLEYIKQNQIGNRTKLQILQLLADRLPPMKSENK